MKITADTNVLLRLVLADDEAQSLAAVEAMESATHVAISVHSLCEL
ncbi:MAG: VapC toxin family PIN domain ribonuclease, partial [Rhodobiaceae bacterium]|nr:VapC toxin family PIN domain ribonuclease [Rhodobiaceae bacterium]